MGVGRTRSRPAQCTRGRAGQGAGGTVMPCSLVGGTGVGSITRGKLVEEGDIEMKRVRELENEFF